MTPLISSFLSGVVSGLRYSAYRASMPSSSLFALSASRTPTSTAFAIPPLTRALFAEKSSKEQSRLYLAFSRK